MGRLKKSGVVWVVVLVLLVGIGLFILNSTFFNKPDVLSEDEVQILKFANSESANSTTDARAQIAKIQEHLNSLCKPLCGHVAVNQSIFQTSGDIPSVYCYCNDASFYLIDARTSAVLSKGVMK